MLTRTRGRVEAILPAGPSLIVHTSANNKQRAGVYDSESGRFVRELVVAGSIGYFSGRLALAPDKRTVFSTFGEGAISQIDIETGRVVRSKAITSDDNVKRDGSEIVVSPDGRIVRFLVWGGLFAWDLETDELTELSFKTFVNNNTGMVASPQGDVIWVDGRRLYRFELASGASFEIDHKGDDMTTDVVHLAGDRLAIGRWDGQVEVWRATAAATLEDTVRIGPKAFHRVRLAALRGGAIIAASAGDERVSLFAAILKDGTEARRIDLAAAMPLSGKESTRARLALDGERAAVLCETALYRESPCVTPPELAVVDLASGAILFTHTFERDIGSMKLDGDALLYATCGGRVEWLPLPITTSIARAG